MKTLRSKSKTERIMQIVLITLMVIVCLVVLFPLFYMTMTAFRTDQDVVYNGYRLIPETFTLKTFTSVLSATSSQPVLRWFGNSFLAAALSTVLTVLVDALAAYGYARMNFKGRDVIFAMLMLTIMIPGVINLIPTYSIVSTLHLKNTVWALVLPGLGGVGNIFLIRQFMYTIPKQLDEAAFIDGAGHVRTFFSVILPQLVPVLVTVGLFSFLGSWNDLLWPLIVMTDTSKRTLTAGLSVLQGQYDRRYASLMAATLVSAIPVMAIYLVAQKYLLQGISFTSGMKD